MDSIAAYYQNLNNFYKTRSGLNVSPYSIVSASVKPISQFKSFDDITLPFLITGRLVSVDAYKDGTYGTVKLSKDALKTTVQEWVGIQIYTSHAVFEKVLRGEDVSVNEVVGKIVKTEWNNEDPGIDFTAEIYDKQIAYKMAHGLIKYISVGFARDVVTIGKEYYFMNLEPKEASLVFDPRDKKAVFKPLNK